MNLNADYEAVLGVLLESTELPREVTPSCPEGKSRWHTARRLITEGLAGYTETDVDRIGRALQRRGLATHKTLHGVTRWALTGTGIGEARHRATLTALGLGSS
jgi:hypothetical protein